jgi:hypothetical protein
MEILALILEVPINPPEIGRGVTSISYGMMNQSCDGHLSVASNMRMGR